ncbi:MAG: hypothetical protein AAFV43_01230 [Planctomycetota bacterium]
MREPQPNAELKRLLAAWCNETIDDTGVERLEQLLAEDSGARLSYLQYSAMEAELWATHATGYGPGAALLSEAADRVAPALADDVEPLPPNSSTAERPAAPRAYAAAFAIAASLAFVAAGSSWLTAKFTENRQRADAPAVATIDAPHEDDGSAAGLLAQQTRSVGQVVATITGTRNCRWGGNTPATTGYNAAVRVGDRLDLVDGVAEITFADGARAVLEGPAELILAGPRDAVLLSGRIAATLPAGAGPPGIRTSRMAVSLAKLDQQNLSAHEFGLSADEERGEEVHVFRGQLRAFLLGGAGAASRVVQLTEHEAARVRPASTTVAKFFASRDEFVRSLASTGGPHDGLYAYDGFDYPVGPLGEQNGGFGWAGAWADIEAACPPGQVATNVVVAGNLQADGVPAIGGSAAQIAQQNRVRRALSTSLGGVFDTASLVENQDGLRLVGANGKQVYLSFVQRVDQLDGAFYGFELHRGDGNGNRVLCIGAGADGAGYGITSNYNGYGPANYPRIGDERTDASFFVVKIEYGADHRDLATVYRNPESLVDERGAEAVARLRGNFAFDRISFGNFDGAKRHEIDEVRIGTTYRAVTGRRDRPADWLAPSVANSSLKRVGTFAILGGARHNACLVGVSRRPAPIDRVATPVAERWLFTRAEPRLADFSQEGPATGFN